MSHVAEQTLSVLPHWNATGQCDESESGSSSTLIGVTMGLVASIGINSGQNLQALGLSVSDEVRAKPYTSRTWCIGMCVFIVGSFLNFAAFSFAASSILVPLEAVQFVTNVAFNKFINKKVIPVRMLAGVALAVSGVALAVVFGSTDVHCFTIEEMISFWEVPLWWIYLILTLVVAASAFATLRRHKAAAKAGRPLPNTQYIQPVSFAVSSSLVGGANMIVHSKAVAELFELQTSGVLIFASWYFYLEFSLLSVTGCIWLYKMNESLGLYDPLFIIPLMQSSYILFGVISGGIFFQEFAGLHNGPAAEGGWVLFILGMVMILFGLYLIAPEPSAEQGQASLPRSPRLQVPKEKTVDPAEVRRLSMQDIACEVVLDNPLVEDPRADPGPTALRVTQVKGKPGPHTATVGGVDARPTPTTGTRLSAHGDYVVGPDVVSGAEGEAPLSRHGDYVVSGATAPEQPRSRRPSHPEVVVLGAEGRRPSHDGGRRSSRDIVLPSCDVGLPTPSSSGAAATPSTGGGRSLAVQPLPREGEPPVVEYELPYLPNQATPVGGVAQACIMPNGGADVAASQRV